MFSTKKVKMLVGAMALALSVGGLGAAYAAAEDQSAAATTVQQKADQGKHLGRGSMFANNEELLSLLNLSAEELQAQLKEGKTLAQIIEAQGASEDEVVDLLVKQQQERLAQKVKAGKLTQEQADKQEENLEEMAKKMLEGTGFGPGGKGFVGGGHFANNEDLLKLLKLTAEELQEQQKAGKSLKEIAEAQGVDVDDVIDLLTKKHEERLAEMVSAGKLTQEQADAQREKLDQMIASLVENPFQGRGGMGFGFKLNDNEDLLKLLNLDADKLKEELQTGKSLATIAEAQGVEEDKLIDLLTKQQEEKLAEAVKAGKLTQEQADKMSENAAEKIKSLIENTHQGKGFGGGFHLKENEDLLKLLNLTAEQLREAMKAGQSLAELAQAQGVDVDDVIDLLTTQREEQLAQAVKDGKLTQEQADQKKANLEESIKKMVESKHEKTEEKTVAE
ncbi:coiled-coil domain-containing protein [Brevibacillus migulae]|uniref:hypothetical protein n=1 Tax=Brevibacillus migulae TaxID=1644114 RepID=UPI00196B8205|nr:hypothetical protein [Brevibacillus migulae]